MTEQHTEMSVLTPEQQRRLALENVARCQEQQAAGLFNYRPAPPDPQVLGVSPRIVQAYWAKRLKWERELKNSASAEAA